MWKTHNIEIQIPLEIRKGFQQLYFSKNKLKLTAFQSFYFPEKPSLVKL